MNKRQQGFGIVGVLVVIVVLAAIAGTGWLVYSRVHNSAAKTTGSLQRQSSLPPQHNGQSSGSPEVKLEAIMDDGSVQQVHLATFAKTADQQAIIKTIAATCHGSDSYVIVNNKVFTDTEHPIFAQDGNYADINASCGPKADNVDQLIGSGMEMYFSKDQSGNWKIDDSTQMMVSCDSIDGKGYPTSIAPECMADGGTTRAPR